MYYMIFCACFLSLNTTFPRFICVAMCNKVLFFYGQVLFCYNLLLSCLLAFWSIQLFMITPRTSFDSVNACKMWAILHAQDFWASVEIRKSWWRLVAEDVGGHICLITEDLGDGLKDNVLATHVWGPGRMSKLHWLGSLLVIPARKRKRWGPRAKLTSSPDWNW